MTDQHSEEPKAIPEVVGADTHSGSRTRIIRGLAWCVATKYTAGSMVYVADADGRVALVRPRRYSDQWTFPGGFIRRAEHPATTALREVREEIGLTLTATLVFVGVYRQGWAGHFDHLYEVTLREQHPALERKRRRITTWIEIGECAWHDPSAPDFRDKLGHDALMAYEQYVNRRHGG